MYKQRITQFTADIRDPAGHIFEVEFHFFILYMDRMRSVKQNVGSMREKKSMFYVVMA